MGLSGSGINEENHIVSGSWIALLIDDSIGTILSVPFCPYHFVQYHFVLEPAVSVFIIDELARGRRWNRDLETDFCPDLSLNPNITHTPNTRCRRKQNYWRQALNKAKKRSGLLLVLLSHHPNLRTAPSAFVDRLVPSA